MLVMSSRETEPMGCIHKRKEMYLEGLTPPIRSPRVPSLKGGLADRRPGEKVMLHL